jgi:hypothetical protein
MVPGSPAGPAGGKDSRVIGRMLPVRPREKIGRVAGTGLGSCRVE